MKNRITQADFLGVCVAPEDCAAVPMVRHPHGIASPLGRHHSSSKAPMYIGHHHIPPVCENELGQTI